MGVSNVIDCSAKVVVENDQKVIGDLANLLNVSTKQVTLNGQKKLTAISGAKRTTFAAKESAVDFVEPVTNYSDVVDKDSTSKIRLFAVGKRESLRCILVMVGTTEAFQKVETTVSIINAVGQLAILNQVGILNVGGEITRNYSTGDCTLCKLSEVNEHRYREQVAVCGLWLVVEDLKLYDIILSCHFMTQPTQSAYRVDLLTEVNKESRTHEEML